MNKLNIITSLCVDPNDSSFNYQLYYLSNRKKREIYWKCCVTFFGTSVRYNPEANHLLVTNDKDKVIINELNIKKFLNSIGVEIIELPFERFRSPKKFSTHHNLTLYKLEVISYLSELKDGFNILLDSDCIWANPYPKIGNYNSEDKLIVYDMYTLSNPLKKIHGINRKDLGQFYKKIDPDYPVEYPVWYGGEIVGGSSNVFWNLSVELKYYFELIVHGFEKSPKLPNKMKIFDGDELILSLVYNKLKNNKVEASNIIKRIWTNPKTDENNIDGQDVFELSVWHMIGEKLYGIPILCDKILDLNSKFWSTNTEELNKYIGLFFGFPMRKFLPIVENKYLTIVPKVISKLKELINNITT